MHVHRKKGFTLMELLLVVVILGILAAVAIPRMAQSGGDAKKNACRTNIALINSQIELYATQNSGTYPADQTEFTTKILNSTTLFPDGAPTCPYGQAYAYDTTLKRVTQHAH
jgi:prepilin-type N-terminal cleavage/methylation domain-containing protein